MSYKPPYPITRMSEDFTNRSQSWYYNAVYRIGRTPGHDVLHVEIRANAYQDQSYAKIEVWGSSGWRWFNSLPVEDWYPTMPSYTKKTLTSPFIESFEFVAKELLERYCETMYGSTSIAMNAPERSSEYEEALGFSALATP